MTFCFRTFTALDWMGYGGAEPFEDGSDPLLSSGDVVIDSEPAEVIIDARGVAIYWCIDDAQCGVHAFGGAGARLLASLRPQMTRRDLAALPGIAVEQL